MKKQSLFLTFLLIATFFTSQAQIKPVAYSEKMMNADEHLAKSAVDLFVMATFREKHPAISNDTWVKTENGYLVSFAMNGILHNVFLNKKGKMTSQIRYYAAKDLPADVRNRIKSFIGCFTIGSVREITTKNSTAYLVTISDSTSWKVIRVVGEEEIDVFEEHEKG